MSAIGDHWHDYWRRSWEWSEHHRRYRRRVEAQKPHLVCQECGGMGGEVDPILDWGQGPWESCGWCEGTGLVTPWLRGEWLAYRRQVKAERSAKAGGGLSQQETKK